MWGEFEKLTALGGPLPSRGWCFPPVSAGVRISSAIDFLFPFRADN